MKSQHHFLPQKSGLTLLEMTIVILVLLALIGLGLVSSRMMDNWKLGREASETLRVVHSAQRMFLADNPTRPVAEIVPEDIIPYLPNGAATMPTVKSLTGTTLNIIVSRTPPAVDAGAGTVYDPSGSETDSLWDVGE